MQCLKINWSSVIDCS